MKIKRIVLFLVAMLMLLTSSVMAATKEDVIAALNATYTVGNETYRLPQSAINKGVNFLNKRKLTSEQYDKILGVIGSAVSLAREAGTTDITKAKPSDIKKGLGLIHEAASVANVSLSEVTSSLYKNAGKETAEAQPNTNTNINENKEINVKTILVTSGEHSRGNRICEYIWRYSC